MSRLNRRQFLQTGVMVPAAYALGNLALGSEADASLQKGPPPLPKEGSFTLAVLPDTQMYCQSNPAGYLAQTQWLVEQKKTRNIAAVLHLGDITNRNSPEQWEVARKAMNQLHGHLPYFFVPGNHDYSAGGRANDRSSLLDKYLPISKFEKLPTFGGTYDKEPESMLNSYHLFSAGGREFLVIGLEFGPRADVVRWANEVAAKHADREAILITHAYTYHDETRYDWRKYGAKQKWNPHSYGVARNNKDDVMDGEELWQSLVTRHENFILTLNGHVLYDGLGRVTSQTPGGRDVHQLLVNFQMKPKGGNGWLRLLEFTAAGEVGVHDYSPTLDQRNVGEQNHFTLDLAKVGKSAGGEAVVVTRLLKDDGVFPNNDKLPLMVYKQAFGPSVTASEIEGVIKANGWGNTWRYGVYDYHHYHSEAHEFLGVFRGSGVVQFGGESGPKLEVKQGDAVVIPAGVAHKKISSSSDFTLVGAYPPGQGADMKYGKEGERPEADENIKKTALPATDPVFGKDGPLMKKWVR